MRKMLAYKVMTTAALLSSLALPAYAGAATSFSDISGSYAKDAIQALVDKGIINGVGDGQFNPTGKIERQDFAIILAKALQLDVSNPPAQATFSDVPDSNYAYKYVEATVKAGLIKGLGNGKFGEGSNLSRQDMAVLFVRALGVDATGKGSNLSFSDAGSIADYAKDAVAAAVELGLIAGNGDGSFNPKGNAERQAVAQVASRFLQAKEQIDNSTPPTPEPTPAPVVSNPGTYTPPPVTTTLQEPTLGFSGSDKLVLDYGSGSVLSSVYSANDFAVTVNTGDINETVTQTIRPKSLQVVGSAIEITLPEPIWAGKKYTVKYENKSGTPVKSSTGLLSPNFTVSAEGTLPGTIRDWVASLLNTVNDELASAKILTEEEKYLGKPGDYTQSVVNQTIQPAILSTNDILDEENPLTYELEFAYDELHRGLVSLHAARLPSLAASAITGPQLFLGNEKITFSADAPNLENNKQNINDLIKLTRGDTTISEPMSFQTDHFYYNSSSSEIVGTIDTDDSDLEVNTDSNGFNVSLANPNAADNSVHSVTFHLTEAGKEISKVDLPVTLDLTPPSVTDSVYDNGSITFTTSETYSNSMGASISVGYLDSSDNVIYLTSGTDYTVNWDGADKKIAVTLTSSGLDQLKENESSRLQISIMGILDRAGNEIQENEIDVPLEPPANADN